MTLPVGALPVTVAVKVTLTPDVDGFSELANVVVVAAPADVETCTVSNPVAPGVAEITLIDTLVVASTNAGAPASRAASLKFPEVAGVMSRISVSSLPELFSNGYSMRIWAPLFGKVGGVMNASNKPVGWRYSIQ